MSNSMLIQQLQPPSADISSIKDLIHHMYLYGYFVIAGHQDPFEAIK